MIASNYRFKRITRQLNATLAVLYCLSLTASSASAEPSANELNQAVKEYTAKNYTGSRDKLLSYLKANSESYQAYYLLGNCYMQLTDLAEAKRCYSRALANKPDETTKDRCLKTIISITQALTASSNQKDSAAAAASASKSKPTGSASNETKLSTKEIRIKQLENEIAFIEKDSEEKLAKTKEEMKAALQAAIDRWGDRWYYPNGECRFGISPERESITTSPYEAKMQQISLDTAMRLESKRKEIEDLSK
jgi:tetratricopeptide (TPR) repeat protein